jgi:hypothetical protein
MKLGSLFPAYLSLLLVPSIVLAGSGVLQKADCGCGAVQKGGIVQKVGPVQKGGIVQKGHPIIQKGGHVAQKGCDTCGISQKSVGWSLLSGAHQKGIVQKGAVQKGPVQKGVIQKGIEQKGPTQKGFIQKSFDPFGILQKGHHQKGHFQKGPIQKGPVQKGHLQKGHLQKGWSLGPIHQKGVHQKGYETYGGYGSLPTQQGCSDCDVSGCVGCRLSVVPRALHNLGGLLRNRLHRSPEYCATYDSHDGEPVEGDTLMPEAVDPFLDEAKPQPAAPVTPPSPPQGSRLTSSSRTAMHVPQSRRVVGEPTPARPRQTATSEPTTRTAVETESVGRTRLEAPRASDASANEPELFRLIDNEVRKIHSTEATTEAVPASVRRVSNTGAGTLVVPHNPLR